MHTMALPGAVSAAADADDALLVFCLSPTHQKDLVDAAMALGVMAPHSSPGQLFPAPAGTSQALSVQEWRTHHPSDFLRTCNALVAAQNPPDQPAAPGPMENALANTLLLVAGALLSALAGAWANSSTRGREAAASVRAALDGATRAVEDYLNARATAAGEPGKLGDQVQARLADLRARIDPLLARRRYRRTAQAITRLLTGQALGETLTRGWLGAGSDVIERRQEEVRAQLTALVRLGNALALALETPHRMHLSLSVLTRKAGQP